MVHFQNSKIKKSAFTLIEIIIVITVVALFMVFIINTVIVTLKLYAINIALIKLKNNTNSIINSFRYTLKQNATEVYQDVNLSIKCSPDNPIIDVDNLFFLDKKGNKFSYFFENGFFASFSSSVNKIYYLNSQDTKIKDLKLSCKQKNIYTSPIISISFKIENQPSILFNDSQEFSLFTKVKLTNF